MSFDFEAALKSANACKKQNVGIYAILLGPRSGGKSGSAAGTWGDANVLLLHFTKEHHAANTAKGVARKNGNEGKITTYCIDQDPVTGEVIRESTAIYVRTLEILRSSFAKKFDVVVFDGLSAFDPHCNSHAEVLKASTYEKTKVLTKLYDELGIALKALYFHGVDIVVTCATEVKIDNGVMVESPKLRGSGTADNMIGEFSELIPVNVFTETDDEGNSEQVVKFNFAHSTLNKDGKKMTGETVKVGFHPRIEGVVRSELPAFTSANMAALKAFKMKKLGE